MSHLSPASWPEPGPWVQRWLSVPRLSTYAHAADGDLGRALALYQWNSRITAALLCDIGHVEIAVRNNYDRTVSAQWRGAQHWLLDQDSPVNAPLIRRHRDVNARTRAVIREAQNRAGKGPPVGKVIAELPLGFWRYMTVVAREKTLWVPYLHHAYPDGTDRAWVHDIITETTNLRNRAAHHETLIKLPLDRHYQQLLAFAGMLGHEFHDFLQVTSTVPRLLQSRP